MMLYIVIVGAAVLTVVAGIEIFIGTRAFLAGVGPWPKELMLHIMVAGSALLLAAAVIMTRRSQHRASTAEAARRETEERLQLVANNVPALISYVDRRGRYRYSNRTHGDWFGIPPDRMLGRGYADIFAGEGYAALREHIARALEGAPQQFELATSEPGDARTLQIACIPHFARGHRGEVLGCYMLGNDVTALKRAQEDLRIAAMQLKDDARRLEFLAHHDALTALPNRAMFEDRAREAVAHERRHGKSDPYLFLDLDNFKPINDRLGHQVGDALLKMIASRLRASVRGEDFVARIGGDEFCVLLQDIADAREAASVAQKLVHELAKPYRIGEHQAGVGASIGIACVPQDGEDVATVLRLADSAMYRVKERGRNGYQFFSPSLNEDVQAAAALARELREGVAHGEFFLAWQPRVDVTARQVVGAEALLRWRHPKLGVLPPDEFLPLAEDLGLLEAVGALVLEEACAQGRGWLDAGRRVAVTVNVGARQLRHGDLAAQVREALERSRLPADLLVIEVPEAVVRDAVEPLVATLGDVVALGARLGIDDFGTGYASLPLLQRLRASSVCIDRELVGGLPQDAERAQLSRALISLARGLNFQVVAKGVERTEQRDFLVEAGCRICQGELIAPPGPAGEIEVPLHARRAA
ncbi:MAG: putative bifunctional diguanylate cyclase/phosphodiesterase [Betaproteobacteria bacterium]